MNWFWQRSQVAIFVLMALSFVVQDAAAGQDAAVWQDAAWSRGEARAMVAYEVTDGQITFVRMLT